MSGASAAVLAVLMLPRFLSVRVESVALAYGGVGIDPGIAMCKWRGEARIFPRECLSIQLCLESKWTR